MKEANLAFALNTHLFSLIQPTSVPSASSTAKTSKTSPVEAVAQSARVATARAAQARPHSPFSWSGSGTLDKVIMVLVAVLVGQALRRGVPYLGEQWEMLGLGGK